MVWAMSPLLSLILCPISGISSCVEKITALEKEGRILTWQTYLILFEILPRQDGVQVGSLAERVPGVMHDAVVVVLQPQ